MGYQRAHIEALRTEMAALPRAETTKQELSKQEAIRLLSRDLLGLHRRKGYTLRQIADWLSERGIEVKPAALRSYLRRLMGARRGTAVAKGETGARQPKAGKEQVQRPEAQQRGASAETAGSSPGPRPVGPGGSPVGQRAEGARARFVPREDTEDI
jgi:hypothetical protein